MNQHAYAARQNATYFQFPLCAFAFGRNHKERLDAIISFGVVEAGRKLWSKLPDESRRNFIKNQKALPGDLDAKTESHWVAVYGAIVTGVSLGSVQHCLTQHVNLTTFIEAFERRHGRDCIVRLKVALVFEARDGNGVTPLELSVLAAIYSVIGRKQNPVLITQRRIACRALGYKSEAVRSAEFSARKDQAKPLTVWTIRSRIDALCRRRFFVRATYGRRQTYYSNRMTQTQLRKAVLEMKTFKFTNDRLRHLHDEAMTNAVRNLRAASQGRPPAVPDAMPFRIEDSVPLEDISE